LEAVVCVLTGSIVSKYSIKNSFSSVFFSGNFQTMLKLTWVPQKTRWSWQFTLTTNLYDLRVQQQN